MRAVIESDETLEGILASIIEGGNKTVPWHEFGNQGRVCWKEISCIGGLMDGINPGELPRLFKLTRKPIKMSSSKYLMLSGSTWRFPPRMGLTILSIPCYSQVEVAIRFRGPGSEQNFHGTSAYVLVIGDNVSFTVSGHTRNNQPLIIAFY